MKLNFKLVDGRIRLIGTQLIWGEVQVVVNEDVTDSVMPVVDDWLDEQLGLNDYKYINGKLRYVGKEEN